MEYRNHYRLLAELFEYPDADYPKKISLLRQFLDGKYVNAVTELDQFIERLPADDLLTMQELFTRSFDVRRWISATCCLVMTTNVASCLPT